MSNQLDNFFKNKLQQQSFDYDESAWEEARILIEQDERSKRKRRFAFLMASIGLLLLVGVVGYQLGKNDNATLEETPTITSIELTEKVDSPRDIIKAEQVADLNTNQEISDYTTMPNAGQTSTTNVNKATKADNKRTFSEETLPSSKKEKTDNNNNKKDNSEYVNAHGVASSTNTSDKSITTNYNPYNVAKATPLFEQSTSTPDKASFITLAPLPSVDFQLLNQPNENYNDLVVNFSQTDISIGDTPLSNQSPSWFFGLRAGAGLVPIKFTDFEAGVEIGFQFNRNWSISTQPKYQYQSLSENMLAESETQEYGFGLRASSFNLEAETVRSIHLPLMLSYSFGRKSIDLYDTNADRYLKNKLSLGLAYVYLDGITATITQREGVVESSVYQSGWLPSEAFNRHNAELMIGFERNISKRFSIGLQARYRLRNQFADNFIDLKPNIVAPNAFYLGLQTSFNLF